MGRLRSSSFLLIAAMTACCLLVGCGVSGKTNDDAATTTMAPKTSAPETTTSTTEGTSSNTTAPNPTETTIPDTTETTIPGAGNPLGTGDIKSTLIRIYKQAGFTDKEARCVANVIVKGAGNGTFNPDKLDYSKLLGAARRCFGADGVPGGSD